jgi:hypothetical protein
MGKDSPSAPNPAHPAAGGAGGVSNPSNPAGGATQTCPSTPCTITSETEHTSPGSRTRTRIGVGERVRLTVNPGPGTWSIVHSNVPQGDPLATYRLPESGTSVTFYAGDVTGRATITAQVGGCSCSLNLDIVAPTGVSIEREDSRGFYHDQGNPSAGFVGRVHLLPDDVNFDAVEYREDEAQATGTGGCSFMTGQGHHPNPSSLPLSDTVIPGRGTRSGIDVVQIRMTVTGQLSPGTVTWSIPWHYSVNGGTERLIARINQVAQMDAAGAVTISKAGASVTKSRNDPSSSMDTTPPVIEDG